MKKTIRVLAIVLTLLMVFPVFGSVASAKSTITSFSDVKKTYWGYETIMSMTRKGLFKGMTEPVNGVGEFWPERTMTRAEFITVSLRAMYPKEAAKVKNQSGNWWKGYYDLALDKGILLSGELDKGALNKAMSRQEMAMVMVRCVEKNGETVDELVSTNKIADYSRISATYKNYVRKCFSLGLIVGVDAKGTFSPTASLTRAQAATVLCRLIDKSEREDVFADGNEQGQEQEKENQTDVDNSENTGDHNDTTWDEFCAMTEEEVNAFIASFESQAAFEKWLEQMQSDVPGSNAEYPWEVPGAKKPQAYTWDEFCALDKEQMEAFIATFESSAAFERWAEKVQTAEPGYQYPWEKPGAKQPDEYTWDEFSDLSDDEVAAFMNWFGSEDVFTAWLEKVA